MVIFVEKVFDYILIIYLGLVFNFFVEVEMGVIFILMNLVKNLYENI